MMPNIDNKINLILQTNCFVVFPPPQPIMANEDTRATSHYFTQADTHVLVNVQPKKLLIELDYLTISQWTHNK